MQTYTGIQSIWEKPSLHCTDQLESQYLGWSPLFFSVASYHHAEKGSCCKPDTTHGIGSEPDDTLLNS